MGAALHQGPRHGGAFSPIRGALGLGGSFRLPIAPLGQLPAVPLTAVPPKHPWVQPVAREGLSTPVAVASPPNAVIRP